MKYFIAFVLFFLHNVTISDETGTLKKKSDNYFLENKDGLFLIETSAHIKKEIKSIVKFDSLIRFKEATLTTSTLSPKQSPTLQSGNIEIKGILRKQGNHYFIENHEDKPLVFANTPFCFGTKFNNKSEEFYLNKEVIALIKEKNDLHLITAIIEKTLYSADDSTFQPEAKIKDGINKNPLKFILQTVFHKNISQKKASFKSIIYNKKPIEVGDTALVITLGGRPNDDLDGQGGHFTVGSAEVLNNKELDIEMFNFYPRFKEKEAIPGHTHFVDFFGGLITGQTNYRPNYTLIVYGVSKKRLAKIRHTMGIALNYMRSSNDPVGGTHNCTTSAWVALNSAGITGKHNLHSQKTIYPHFPAAMLTHTPNKYSPIKTLLFAQEKSWSEICPRLAFESLAQGLMALNPKRIDFIFQQQVPSDRAQGGAPIKTLSDYLWVMKKYREQKTRMKQYDLNEDSVYLLKWIDESINTRLNK